MCVPFALIYQFQALRQRGVNGKWYTPISNGISYSEILLTIYTNRGRTGF